MRKIKTFLALFFIFALTLSAVPTALAAQLDASNETGSVSLLTIGSHSKCAQTFKPTLPTLNSISVYLGNGDGSVTLRLIKVSSGETIYGESKGIGAWTWYTFTPGAGSVPVNTGEDYEINISAGAASTTQWKLGTNGYANGMAYYPDADPATDFYFRTYGTPAASPSASSSATPTSSPAPGSGIIGSAPAKTTDSSIKTPTNLKAEDVSDKDKNEPKVKLTWEASKTSDIDGYRVYSRKEGDADFALAADINKSTLEYTDSKVEFNKKYTYMIRANKSTKESASSNEVTITPNKGTLTNYGFLSFAGPLWKQWYFWALVALGLALVGCVIWYIVDRKKKKKADSVDSLKS